jgi:hypothetical protein
MAPGCLSLNDQTLNAPAPGPKQANVATKDLTPSPSQWSDPGRPWRADALAWVDAVGRGVEALVTCIYDRCSAQRNIRQSCRPTAARPFFLNERLDTP